VTPHPEAAPAIALVLPGETLVCPRGHTVPKHVFLDFGHGYRCQFRSPPGDQICGAALLVFPTAKVVVDVTTQQLVEMEKRQLTVAQIRDVVGLRWRSSRNEVGWDSEAIIARCATIAPQA
jgi:hypothetical protein